MQALSVAAVEAAIERALSGLGDHAQHGPRLLAERSLVLFGRGDGEL
jgi:hypothetical protein